MFYKNIRTIATALTVSLAAPTNAEVRIWSPDDYNGAFVYIIDKAKNGCWTNIGEVETYGTDQLALAGFKTVEKPEENTEPGPNPILEDSLAMLIVEVSGSRWNDGLCVGQVQLYIVGPTVMRSDRDAVIMSAVGFPEAWTIWNPKNFNNQVLDTVSAYINTWIEEGKIDDEE